MLRAIPFEQVDITGGFWQHRQELNTTVTIPAIQRSYGKTGRFAATECKYRKWKIWTKPPHIFYDSDVAKWIESAAYSLAKHPDDRLMASCDRLIANIARNQQADGYYNAHFLVTRQQQRFSLRWEHELYCLGHLIEAAIAYKNATGSGQLLEVVEKYTALVDRVFRQENSAAFATGGHPEIELALVKLWHATGKREYLELSKHFVDIRGTQEGLRGTGHEHVDCTSNIEYAQDQAPLRDQRTAEGHAVRAMYIYSAMADLSVEYSDPELLEACVAIYTDMAERKMYVTGGIGSRADNEGFGEPFVLPNDRAYTESCAAIGVIMFATRLRDILNDTRYSDMVERVLYNGFLSGISMTGERFFYENPLEIDLEYRAKHRDRYPLSTRPLDYSCSCCPPNISRLLGSIGGYAYATDDTTVYVEQFMTSSVALDVFGDSAKLHVTTSYPADGTVSIRAEKLSGKHVAVRIPVWCTDYTVDCAHTVTANRIYVDIANDDMPFAVVFSMLPVIHSADERVLSNRGKAYVTRGPIVYCAEGVDNGKLSKYALSVSAYRADEESSDEYLAPVLRVKAFRSGSAATLRMIPYFAFANRGETDMRVYLATT